MIELFEQFCEEKFETPAHANRAWHASSCTQSQCFSHLIRLHTWAVLIQLFHVLCFTGFVLSRGYWIVRVRISVSVQNGIVLLI